MIQFAESPSAARSAASSTSLALRAHPAVARTHTAAHAKINRPDKLRRITPPFKMAGSALLARVFHVESLSH
jgi:hypothetical protein